MADFGQYPLDIIPDELGENYSVAGEHVAQAELFGITATFPRERLSIMEARAAAYGYVFAYPVSDDEQVDAAAAVEAVQPTQAKLKQFQVPARPKSTSNNGG